MAALTGCDFAGSEKFKNSRIKKADAAKNAKRSLELKHLPSFSLTLQDTHSSSPRACQTHMAKNTHAPHPPEPKRKDPEINLESRAGRKTKLGAEEEFLVRNEGTA